MKLTLFISPTKRLTRARQEYLTCEYEVEHTVESDIEEAIKHMRKGRGLLVAQCSVLGRRSDDIRAVAAKIHERGGYIIEGATGRDSRVYADAFEMGLDAGRRKSLTPPQARKIATKYDKDDENLARAREMWGKSRYTIDDISKVVGIPRSTLIRRLGKRKMPPGPRTK